MLTGVDWIITRAILVVGAGTRVPNCTQTDCIKVSRSTVMTVTDHIRRRLDTHPIGQRSTCAIVLLHLSQWLRRGR